MKKNSVLTFHARSTKRDAKIDEFRLSSLAHTLESTIRDMAEERSGLIARVKGLAASDEIGSRSGRKPGLSLAEFRRVESRLDVLARRIAFCGQLKDRIDTSWPIAEPITESGIGGDGDRADPATSGSQDSESRE